MKANLERKSSRGELWSELVLVALWQLCVGVAFRIEKLLEQRHGVFRVAVVADEVSLTSSVS